jgi:hypothetical protein
MSIVFEPLLLDTKVAIDALAPLKVFQTLSGRWLFYAVNAIALSLTKIAKSEHLCEAVFKGFKANKLLH